MTHWVYRGYKETYRKLGISFDKQYFESQIYEKGVDIIMKALARRAF